MFGLYLFSLILGLGVILIDLLGLLGPDGESPSSEDLDASDDAMVLPDDKKGKWIYTVLNFLRSIIYFCGGFGAVGIFGSLTDRSGLNTFVWSCGTGIILLIIIKLIMKLQNNVIDSQLKSSDLLFSEAEVLVTIYPEKMGRIRVHSGGIYHDLFAQGRDPIEYSKGTKVFVVDVSFSDPIVHTDRI